MPAIARAIDATVVRASEDAVGVTRIDGNAGDAAPFQVELGDEGVAIEGVDLGDGIASGGKEADRFQV